MIKESIDDKNPSYSLDHVSIGSNRRPNSASFGYNGLVVYSASKFVCLYDPFVSLKFC